jgi:hypothetical protein
MARALQVLKLDIIHYINLPPIDLKKPVDLTANDIVLFPWFADWLVGFTQSEGSFSTDDSTRASWSIYQSHDTTILKAI